METIEMETTWWQGESQINIDDLLKTEISLVASMFSSKELFTKITTLISAEDFTFIVTRMIFEYLVKHANEVDFYANENETINIARYMGAYEDIFIDATIKILTMNPSKNIDLDLAELLDFSKKRQELWNQDSNQTNRHSKIIIEDKYGEYIAVYFDGIIESIYATYIFHLPNELCDTFKYTFEKIIPYVQKEDYNFTMNIDENTPETVESFMLSKDISKIKKLKKLLAWGRKNNLKESQFSQNRGELQSKIMLSLDNRNLKYIPDEFCEFLPRVLILSLLNNNLKTIPKNINLLRNCILLGLCDNCIEFLPKSLYELKSLSILCLHGNRLQEISHEVSNFTKLKKLSLSNNPIKTLPPTIAKLTNLVEIDIENTLIDESSLDFITLENIESICFDDRLLPYFIKNFHRLKNINTINLTHSEYKKDDEAISSLGLKFDDNTWMEDKDYQGHGCVKLKKQEI